MSYQATTIVLYGVKLNGEETEKLRNYIAPGLSNEDCVPLEKAIRKIVPDSEISRIHYYPGIPNSVNNMDAPGNIRTSPREYHFPEVLSDNSDSRIHTLQFDMDEGIDTHYFGIYCGSRGYAYADEIEEIINNLPEKAEDNFELYCKSVLEGIGITSTPKIHLVTQTW